MSLGILFLDDDPIMRNFRLLLSNRENDPWIANYFLPEVVDMSPLAQAAKGLRVSEGARIGLATDGSSLDDAAIIVFRRGNVDKALLDRHPNLRLIQRLGERSDTIDLAEACRRKIPVSCLSRPTIHFTAEHTVLLMMALSKKLLESDRAVRGGHAYERQMPELADPAVALLGTFNYADIRGASGLYGKTLGIVGMGEAGAITARICTAIGMRVSYNNRRRVSPELEARTGAHYAERKELLANADHVSLTVANIEENVGMANREFFAAMKSSAFFINTSRGRLVDEDALYMALTEGVIAGAGLDVHARESRQTGNRFTGLSNVVLTPHIAAGSRSTLLQEYASLLSNMHAALRGERVEYEATARTS